MTLAAAALLMVFGPAGGMPEPHVKIPQRPPIFWFQGEPPCAELPGFDLRQGGRLIEGPPFRVREGTPLDLTLYWRPLRALPKGAEVGVNLRSPGVGPGPGHYKRYPLEVEGWSPGKTCRQYIRHALPLGKFAGAGYFNLFLTHEGATAADWAWLYRAPAVIEALEPPNARAAEK